MLQSNLLRRNPNAVIDFLQIKIFPVRVFDCLLSAKALLTIIDFLPKAGQFEIDILFSPEKFDLGNYGAVLKEKSWWLLPFSHRTATKLHFTFSIIHFDFCRIKCLSHFLDLFECTS